MARKALGKGLDALIPVAKEKPAQSPPLSEQEGGISQINLTDIVPGAFQPRKHFDEQAINELSESIKTQGILQPLLVRPGKNGGFELIAGERRFRAAKKAGLKTAPVIIKEVDDKNALELALVENLQREELDSMEEAEGFQKLILEFGYTQEQLSKRVGKDRATISNTLRLLKLPEEFQDDLRDGLITAGHARAMLQAGTESLMQSIHDKVINEGISVREAERMAQSFTKPGKSKQPTKTISDNTSASLDVNLKEMENILIRELETRVKIVPAKKGGKIEIDFYSEDDLDRIYGKISGK